MWNGRGDACGGAAPSEAGFSLVEALVALFLFGVASVGLIQLQTQSLRLLQAAETRSLAGLAAQNRLVETLAALQAPSIGVSEGDSELGGRRFRWRLTTQATQDRSVLQVSVVVFDEAGAAAAEAAAFTPVAGVTP